MVVLPELGVLYAVIGAWAGIAGEHIASRLWVLAMVYNKIYAVDGDSVGKSSAAERADAKRKAINRLNILGADSIHPSAWRSDVT
jgi:hypothetical protein